LSRFTGGEQQEDALEYKDYHEQDTAAVIEDAVERCGGIDKVTLDDLSVPAYIYCIRHLLNKDN
jgi:hypothetical protein